MSGMIMVKSHAEENLLLTLVSEFGTKVVLPRNFKPNDTFTKYQKAGIYGITGVEVDEKTNEALFQIELPPAFVQYIQYEIDKLRNFVVVNAEEPQGKNILV